jgi:Integrase zinc binding domain
LSVDSNNLWHKLDTNRLYVPDVSELRHLLISEFHDPPYRGHFGIAKTLKAITSKFYWPKMDLDIKGYIDTCEFCQQSKSTNQHPLGLLQPLDIPDYNWQSISLDFVTGLAKFKQGHTAILTVVDRLSKMVHLIPTTTTVTAAGTASLICQYVFKLHGVPESIVPDLDTHFTSHFWQVLHLQLGTKLRMSTAHHPQTDGLTERMNRTMEQVLRNFVNDSADDWEDFLPPVQFAINNSKQGSSTQTPLELVYRGNPRTPDALLQPIKL